MEAIRQTIASIIDIDVATMSRLLDKLAELGVANVDDLTDVEFGDITPEILLPIPARKLLRICKLPLENITNLNVLPLSQVAGPSFELRHSPSSIERDGSLTTDSRHVPCNMSPNWHTSFDAHKIVTGMLHSESSPSEQLAAKNLLSGSTLSAAQRNEVVRHVANEIFKLCKTPTRQHLNAVADGMAARYIKLRDEIDGAVIGCGYSSLRNQLENRISYLKRPVSTQRQSAVARRRLHDDDDEGHPQTSVRDGYGCVDFLPITLPVEESEDSLNAKQQKLKEAFQNSQWSDIEICGLMADTYILQRRDLVGSKVLSVNVINTEWPFLMKPKWMIQHLERLLGCNVVTTFETELLKRKSTLFSFFRLQAAAKKNVLSGVLASDVVAEPACLIQLLMAYFGDDEKVLFKGCEVLVYFNLIPF